MSVFFGIEYYLVYLVFSAKKCTPIGLVINNLQLNWNSALHRQKPWIKSKTNPVRKYSETTLLFKKGLNILRSAEVMNSLVFSDMCDRFTMIKSLFTALYC